MKGKMPAKLFRVDRWQRKTKIVVSIVLLVLIVVGLLSTMMPTREEMLANTARYACGHYTRELVPGSLRVHPVKDFGAISQGTHRFCQVATGSCDGIADFTMVWRLHDGQWRITRVLSYGHRPAAD